MSVLDWILAAIGGVSCGVMFYVWDWMTRKRRDTDHDNSN